MPLKFGSNSVDCVVFNNNTVNTVTYNGTEVFSSSALDPFAYTLLSDGTYEVRANNTDAIDSHLTIPSTYKNTAVTAIAENGFKNLPITSLDIPNSIKTIGSGAFEDCSLCSITFGTGVETISEYAFHHCKNITSLTIPKSVKLIDDEAFASCTMLQNVIFEAGGSVYIDYAAFGSCPLLQTVTMNDSVKTVYDQVFEYCTALTNVTLSNQLTDLSYEMFYGCTSLQTITIPNSVKTISDECFYNCTGLTSINIPGNVTHIYGSAFYKCTSLTSITLNEGLKYLDGIGGCPITSINIPSTVETISAYAFSGCTKLQSCTFASNSALKTIGDGAFEQCSKLLESAVFTGYIFTIPDSVTSIGKGIFRNCKSAEFMYLDIPFLGPNATTGSNLGYLFSTNADLSSVPSSDPNRIAIRGGIICADAFANTYVTTLVLGENVTLNEFSLRDASYISDLTIPSLSTYTIAYYYAGYTNGYQNQLSVNFRQSDLTSTSIYNKGIKALRKVTVLKGTIATNAFAGCNLLTHITINGSSGNNSFYNCEKLTTFRSNGGYLASNALKGITTLTSVTLGDGFLGTLNNAFEGCTGITQITIPETLISLGDYTFKNCTKLSNIYCDNNDSSSHSFTTIGVGVFDGCTSLGHIELPATLTACSSTLPQGVQVAVMYYGGSIDDWCSINFEASLFTSSAAFYIEDSFVKNVTINTDVKKYALMSLNQITTVNIGDDCTYIGQYAFAYSSVTTVTGCSRLEQVSSYAFLECTSLTSFAFKPALTTLEEDAFSNCIKLDISTGLYDTSISHLPSYCFYINGTKYPASQVTGRTNIALPVTLRTFKGPVFSKIGTSQVAFNDGYSWDVSYYDGSQDVSGTYKPSQLTGELGLKLIANSYSKGTALVTEDPDDPDYHDPDVVVDSEGNTIQVGVTVYHNAPGYNAAGRQFGSLKVTCYYATTSALNYQHLESTQVTIYAAPTTVQFRFDNSSTYYFLQIVAEHYTPTGAVIGRTQIQERNEAYEEPASSTT